jgi:hypothetical protein
MFTPYVREPTSLMNLVSEQLPERPELPGVWLAVLNTNQSSEHPLYFSWMPIYGVKHRLKNPCCRSHRGPEEKVFEAIRQR